MLCQMHLLLASDHLTKHLSISLKLFSLKYCSLCFFCIFLTFQCAFFKIFDNIFIIYFFIDYFTLSIFSGSNFFLLFVPSIITILFLSCYSQWVLKIKSSMFVFAYYFLYFILYS